MKRALPVFVAAVLPTVLSVHAQVTMHRPAAGPAAAPKGGFIAPEERKPLSPQVAEILQAINAYRAAGAVCGNQAMPPAPPVEWHDALERAASAHLRDMVPRNGGGITHDGSDGSSVGDRLTRQQYEWGGVGENVAAGRGTAAATLAQWMASPGHCRNMMGRDYRHVAVSGGRFPGTPYEHYWVMVLARPLR